MNNFLLLIKTQVYDKCEFEISNIKVEAESKEYDACQFKLNGLTIISRSAKVTPKKVGQFVTFWKRNVNGPIEPFNYVDPFDFYIVNVKAEKVYGQFVFPKKILVKKGILSTNIKEGKRAFRVYPSWDKPKNKQAERTQKWQLRYFYEISNSIDFAKIEELYNEKTLKK